MQAFAELLEKLILTPSRHVKIRHVCDYLERTPDPSRGWALAALAGTLEITSVRPAAIRELVCRHTDPVLFRLSYDYVGDLAETVSLIWPAHRDGTPPAELADVVALLNTSSRTQSLKLVEGWLNSLDPSGRWALLKLITGGLRIGVSGRLARQALAAFGQVDITQIEEIWHGLRPPYVSLFAWLEGKGAKPDTGSPAPFRPPMLAHPLLSKAERHVAANPDLARVTPGDFAAEWKWDGVRVQLVGDQGVRRIYTRNGEDISRSFPDLLGEDDIGATLDGELLIRSPQGGIAPFNDLQQRLNRKSVSRSDIHERPAILMAYDILLEGSEDLRALSFHHRRRRLERFVVSLGSPRIDLSPLVPFGDMDDLDQIRRQPPTREIEGVMLKRWDSAYIAGRPAGLWYKWKRDPFLIDAVLMYAQRGHGRRSGLYSDFTFGVWRNTLDGQELTPVGKAYFGFSDEELSQLDRYVRHHTIARFGPVRSVTANAEEGLVLEIAFEGLQRSSRHKSGVSMRFPRIHRIRWDKPARDADRMEALESLLAC